jgi:hypothetical protein
MALLKDPKLKGAKMFRILGATYKSHRKHGDMQEVP